MCSPPISPINNSSEDVYDLLILESEREETEQRFRIENRNFNIAFTLDIMEQEQPFEMDYQVPDLPTVPTTNSETFVNPTETNFEFIPANFDEECEIQGILRGEY